MERIEEKLINNSTNTTSNFVFALKTLTPYKTVFVALEEDKKIELKKISSLVAGLNEISDKDVKLFAFEMPKQYNNLGIGNWDSRTRKELGERVGNALYEVISELEKDDEENLTDLC